jgi:L-ascorbate metabolism protein UlaG (beta-lactamase superfamily)
MMTSRRTFLASLGLAALSPALCAEDPRGKRSRWSWIFGSPETKPAPFLPEPETWSNNTITATWIGLSTILVNFFGTWIITDPVYSTRIGLEVLNLHTFGLKRITYPALPFSKLPKIDLILLSHVHMDHCDLPTLQSFHPTTPVIMAKNTSDVLDELSFLHVHELDWGERMHVRSIEIEALHVKHFGWRFPWESDRSRGSMDGRSFNAYLLTKNGKSIVFGGDMSYHEYFRPVGKRNLDVVLAMMPIGAYDPWIRNHCNPEQAVEMAGHLGAKHILPMHWGTFLQSDEPEQEPIERFQAALKHRPEAIALTACGQTWKN